MTEAEIYELTREFDYYWLASFPRSGNTLLRQVLHSGWDIPTTSIYPNDLGNNKALETSCGHYEGVRILNDGTRLMTVNRGSAVKTHRLPANANRAIYIVRDARAAMVSFHSFAKGRFSLPDIVAGRGWFSLWSKHVDTWVVSGLVDCFLRYEDLVGAPDAAVNRLAAIFGPPRNDPLVPLRKRNEYADKDGRWVRKESDWRVHWTRELDELFWQVHGATFSRYYPDARPLF